MDSLVYIENNDTADPAVNLAMEEFVLRHMDPSSDYLMLYRNEPSVIIGRNQNSLEEVNDNYVRGKGIHILRRLSGGGAVYHDYGNLNFSFVTRYEQSRLHNFRFFNEPVIKVLQSIGVPAELNDRNDIIANGRKISGNAQFSSRGRMFSHGTLLFDSDLDEVEQVLTTKINGIYSRSHKSVRSVVANISEFLCKPMNIHRFKYLLLEKLLNGEVTNKTYRLTPADHEEINRICRDRYHTWEWNIGRSPKFNIIRSRDFDDFRLTVQLEVEKGIIRDALVQVEPEATADISEIGYFLTGLRYEPETIRKALEILKPQSLSHKILRSDFQQLVYGEDEQ